MEPRPEIRANPPTSRPRAILLTLAVAVLAMVPALFAYRCFLAAPRQLFAVLPHDRNAHYEFGTNLALDLLHKDCGHLLHDLDGARVWGILHGILVGLVQVMGGIDFRLAVLPSLAGWVLTAVMGFLLARRLAPEGGTLAGLVAVLFILASPAHHAFATDVMLESLGAFLSLLVVYCYVVTIQEPARKRGRFLGLALTLLFLLKSNYWTLMMIALVAAELARQPRVYWQVFQDVRRQIFQRSWFLAQVKQPLNYLLALVVASAMYVAVTGGGTVSLFGLRLSFHAGHNLIHLAYAILFLRFVKWWWQGGKNWVREQGETAWQIAGWHIWPVALWFLLPKRLGYFLWYISPADACNIHQPWTEGALSYWRWFAGEYHPALWCAILALVLVGIALLNWRRLRPGSGILFWLLLLAAFLTISHPLRKGRFLHSWVAMAWGGAGVGLAQCCYSRFSMRWPRARSCLAGATAGCLALLLVPGMFQPRAVPDGGPRFDLPSNLELTDAYLPYLADSRKTLILCNNVAMKQFARWTYLERYGNLHGTEIDVKGFGNDYLDNRKAFENWLKTTTCDTLVLIDIPQNSCFYVMDAHTDYNLVESLLQEQMVFHFYRKIELSQFGCAIYLWTREKS